MSTELAKIKTEGARLPQTYENAKQALQKCEQIDECKDWADKAEALASYARQANDDTLHHLALRIKARATRRAHMLSKDFDGRKKFTGNRYTGKISKGDLTSLTRKKALSEAGFSTYQQRTISRIGAIPEERFERLVESDDPPTLSKLAEIGRKPLSPEEQKRKDYLESDKPEGFKNANLFASHIYDLYQFCSDKKNNPTLVINGIDNPDRAKELRQQIKTIENWFDQFIVNLK